MSTTAWIIGRPLTSFSGRNVNDFIEALDESLMCDGMKIAKSDALPNERMVLLGISTFPALEAAKACFMPLIAVDIGRHWSISCPERISIMKALKLE
tara:strand:+ start:1423 stop:1713 length:291 start_codon:yes stop_codon:yes gene_type:complete